MIVGNHIGGVAKKAGVISVSHKPWQKEINVSLIIIHRNIAIKNSKSIITKKGRAIYMTTQIAATPVLKGNDAVRAINAANRKSSDVSRKGEAVLEKKFASMIKK